MIKQFSFAASLLATSLFCHGAGLVTLHCQPECAQTSIEANDLAQLVTQPVFTAQTDWQGARLSTPGRDVAAKIAQQQLITRLNTLATQLPNNAQTQQLRLLTQRLSQLPVAGHIDTPLDPDWVRLKPERMLPLAGEYSLYVNQAASKRVITIWNASQPSLVTPFIVGQQVRDYVAEALSLPGRMKDKVTVIAPDGTATDVPVGYWNRRAFQPMPGSQIWLNLDVNALPDGYQDINQAIVNLLAHRIAAL